MTLFYSTIIVLGTIILTLMVVWRITPISLGPSTFKEEVDGIKYRFEQGRKWYFFLARPLPRRCPNCNAKKSLKKFIMVRLTNQGRGKDLIELVEPVIVSRFKHAKWNLRCYI